MLSWIIAGLIAGIVLWTLMLLWNVFTLRGYHSVHSSSPMPLGRTPRVSILVPARNEAETICMVAEALSAQKYSGSFRIIIVDDASTDGTADIARSASTGGHPIEVISAPPLPAASTTLTLSVLLAVSVTPDSDQFFRLAVAACQVAPLSSDT